MARNVRRYEYRNEAENSNKFWEIEVQGRNVTASWGRIGATPQVHHADHWSPGEARRQANRQIASKMSKGYRLVSDSLAEARARKEAETEAKKETKLVRPKAKRTKLVPCCIEHVDCRDNPELGIVCLREKPFSEEGAQPWYGSLGLKDRAASRLFNGGPDGSGLYLNSLEELTSKTRQELLRLEGFGKLCLYEVEMVLLAKGLRLEGATTPPTLPEIPRRYSESNSTYRTRAARLRATQLQNNPFIAQMWPNAGAFGIGPTPDEV